MAFVFITGSTDGLGRAAAQALIGQEHRVVLHARSQQRAATLADLSPRSAGIVVGDLRSAVETRSIADQSMPSAGWMQSSTMPASTPCRSGLRPRMLLRAVRPIVRSYDQRGH
jgi:NAD(P)-dependent dehydrogenase (short-subunit alcohol dehydrogenase family)